MENKEFKKIKRFLLNYAITLNGDTYSFANRNYYPMLVENELAKLYIPFEIDTDSSDDIIPYVKRNNKDNKIHFFLLDNARRFYGSFEPFEISKDRISKIKKIRFYVNTGFVIFFLDQTILCATYLKRENKHYFKELKTKKSFQSLKFLDACMKYGKTFAFLTVKNELLLYGNEISDDFVEEFTKKDGFVNISLPNDKEYSSITFMNHKLIIGDKNSHYFIFNKIKSPTSPLHMESIIDYKTISYPLSGLNDPRFNHEFILKRNNQVVMFNENEKEIYRIYDFPLETNEAFTQIYRGKSQSLFLLTNHGRLFGIGKNDEFQLKNFNFSSLPVSEPILVNPFLDVKNPERFLLKLIQEYFDDTKFRRAFIGSFYTIKPKSTDLISFYLISNNYNGQNHISITKDLIIKLMKKMPTERIKILDRNLHFFRDINEIEIMSRLIPEFILVFHREDLPLITFLKYLKPIIKKTDGTTKSFRELILRGDCSFGLNQISDNLNWMSDNFLLSLVNLGVKFNFISYPFIMNKKIEYKFFHDERFQNNKLPLEVLNKIQSDCSLEGIIPISQVDQIDTLVKFDFYILAQRLIENHLLSKEKFMDLYQKEPRRFSIQFVSYVLSANIKKSKQSQQIESSNGMNGFSFFPSSRYTTYISVNHHVYLIGSCRGFELNIRGRFTLPIRLDKLFEDYSIQNIDKFAGTSDSILLTDKNNHLIALGSVLKEFIDLMDKNLEDGSTTNYFQSPLIPQESLVKILITSNMGSTHYILTSFHRVLMIGENDLFPKYSAHELTSFIDITNLIPLKKGEIVKDIQSTSSNFLMVFTSQSRILYKLHFQNHFLELAHPFISGEEIINIKISSFGIILESSNGDLWMTQVSRNLFNDGNILNYHWDHKFNGLNDSYDDNFEYLPLLFDKKPLNFQLNKDEVVIHWDIHNSHALIITNHGSVILWGDNTDGALGTNEKVYINKLDLSFLEKDEHVTLGYCGDGNTFLLTDKNRIFSFGCNSAGQLGIGTSKNRSNPTDITKNFK